MITAVVVVGLVSYRVWRLLAADAITEPVRRWLFFKEQMSPVRVVSREWAGPFEQFLYCPWCSGTWVTGLVTLVAWQTGLTADPLWVWPAASVVVGVLGDHT